MNYFHFNISKKYTLALFDSFNDIQVERTLQDGSKAYITVPITYGSKDKAFVFSQMDIEQWQTNNYNVLPRMSLSCISMVKDPKRDTNKLHTINKTINGKNINFQYNAVSWNYIFELAVATRSVTELFMVIEQILPHFNPTLNLVIKEIELLEDTTIPVNLTSIDLDIPTNIGQDDDIRIVGALIMLELKGNIYQPFKDSSVIEQVRLYMNTWDAENSLEEERRSIKYEMQVANGHVVSQVKTDWEDIGMVAKNPPMLHVIEGPTLIKEWDRTLYSVSFIDPDDEDFFTYNWSSDSNAIIEENPNGSIYLTAQKLGDFILSVTVTDRDGNISEPLNINITVE